MRLAARFRALFVNVFSAKIMLIKRAIGRSLGPVRLFVPLVSMLRIPKRNEVRLGQQIALSFRAHSTLLRVNSAQRSRGTSRFAGEREILRSAQDDKSPRWDDMGAPEPALSLSKGLDSETWVHFLTIMIEQR